MTSSARHRGHGAQHTVRRRLIASPTQRTIAPKNTGVRRDEVRGDLPWRALRGPWPARDSAHVVTAIPPAPRRATRRAAAVAGQRDVRRARDAEHDAVGRADRAMFHA
jgi:hypothetical protein